MAFSNTLSEIRQYLASAIGDLLQGQCGTTSADTTHTYAPFLWKPNDYYNNHFYEVYVYAGKNVGVTRRAIGWVLTSKLLEIHTAYAAACDATSYIELHRIFTEDELRKATNLSIEMADDYLIDKIDVATTLVASTYEYTLPTDMSHVHRVTTEREADTGTFDVGDAIDPRDWDLISPRKLKLHENRYSVVAGKDLRIEGQGRQATVGGDTDIIELPPDWLIQKAITFLPGNKIQSNALDDTYRRALIISENIPVKHSNPWARQVVE